MQNHVADMINRVEWEKMPKDKARAAKIMIDLAASSEQSVAPNGDHAFNGAETVDTLVEVNNMMLQFLIHTCGDDEADKNLAYLVSGTLIGLTRAMQKMNGPSRKMVKLALKNLEKTTDFKLAKFK